MGIASQKKGAEGERALCALLDQAGYPVIWGGNKTYGKRPDIRGLPGIHVECKYVERLNLYGAMEQAERDSERFNDGSPTVFQKRKNDPWLVTMGLQDWLALYTAAQGRTPPASKRARLFYREQPSVFPAQPAENIPPKIQPKKGEKEKMIENQNVTPGTVKVCVDTGRNVLSYYPDEGRLSVARPNWTDKATGEIRPGKTVALYLDALKSSPEAVELFKTICAEITA